MAGPRGKRLNQKVSNTIRRTDLAKGKHTCSCSYNKELDFRNFEDYFPSANGSVRERFHEAIPIFR